MRKIHLQGWTSLAKLATVVRGMHRAGLYISRPTDIIDTSLDAAIQLFKAEPFFREDEANEYLSKTGFHSSIREKNKQDFLKAAEFKNLARTELEELIERVGRGPSTPDEIKEMLSQPVKGVDEGGTHLSEMQEVDSEEVSGSSRKGVQGGKS